MKGRRRNKYTTIKIPSKLAEFIDNYMEEHQEYTSRTDVVKEAIRNHLRETENIIHKDFNTKN